MKILIEFGELEMKHRPYPFAGVEPKLRCWAANSFDGARVELPAVHGLYTVGGTRIRCSADVLVVMDNAVRLGYPKCLIVYWAGGKFEAQQEDWKVLGARVVDGEVLRSETRQLGRAA